MYLYKEFSIFSETPGPTPPPLVADSPLPTDVRSAILKGNYFKTSVYLTTCHIDLSVYPVFFKAIVSVWNPSMTLHTGESHTEKVEVVNPVNLTLECTWAGNRDKQPNITGLWRKDGEEIENSLLMVQLENEQYNLRRVYVHHVFSIPLSASQNNNYLGILENVRMRCFQGLWGKITYFNTHLHYIFCISSAESEHILKHETFLCYHSQHNNIWLMWQNDTIIFVYKYLIYEALEKLENVTWKCLKSDWIWPRKRCRNSVTGKCSCQLFVVFSDESYS